MKILLTGHRGFEPKYTVEKFLTDNNLGNIINLFNGETK